MPRINKIFQIIGVGLWCTLLSPAVLVIGAQKSIHPQLTESFTASDILYLLGEIFAAPGQYDAWVLSASGLSIATSDWFAMSISALLFSPFLIWPFLRADRYRFLRNILLAVTVVFSVLCVSLSAYIFLA